MRSLSFKKNKHTRSCYILLRTPSSVASRWKGPTSPIEKRSERPFHRLATAESPPRTDRQRQSPHPLIRPPALSASVKLPRCGLGVGGVRESGGTRVVREHFPFQAELDAENLGKDPPSETGTSIFLGKTPKVFSQNTPPEKLLSPVAFWSEHASPTGDNGRQSGDSRETVGRRSGDTSLSKPSWTLKTWENTPQEKLEHRLFLKKTQKSFLKNTPPEKSLSPVGFSCCPTVSR